MGRRKIERELITLVTVKRDDYYRLAFQYVKNEADALDIVQDSIIKAMKSVHRLQKEQSMNSWFYKIVVHTSLDSLRKHKRMTPVDGETLDYYSIDIEDSYENIDLKRSLDKLPMKYRSIIMLRYFEDLKIQDVADILGEKENTIKTRLYRALKLLKMEME